MKRSKILWRAAFGLMALGLVGALILGLRSDFSSDIGKAVTLADGTTLTLRAVTYGKENRYPGDTSWQRFVAKLPQKWTRKYLGSKNLMSSAEPEIVFWIERNGPATINDQTFMLADTAGFKTATFSSMMQLSATGNRIEGWAFSAWPRREPTFKLYTYQRGKRYGDDTLIGDFTVRNPTPGSYPNWPATPLPITNHAGDLTVVLFDVTAGVGQGSLRFKPAKNPTIAQTRLGFYVSQNGEPTHDWQVVSVEATDATGNQLRQMWGNSFEPNSLWVALNPHLWPAESAWKLRVGFTRRKNFEPKDLWTVSFPIPETNTSAPAIMATNLNGARLEYCGQKHLPWMKSDLQVNFRITPEQPDYQLSLVAATDDQGRPLAKEGSSTGSILLPDRRQDHTFGFHTTNVTAATVTLALHQTRYFEFSVKPQIATTNSASSPPSSRPK